MPEVSRTLSSRPERETGLQAKGVRRLAGITRLKRKGLWALITCMAVGPVLAGQGAAQVQQVVSESDFTYVTSFTWHCSQKTWKQLIDHPLLMAQLWQAYGYAPPYRVSSRSDTIHVDDPTGLVGKVLTVGKTATKQTYLVLGKLDHWAVPFFNQGTAVFELHSRFEKKKISGDLTVYIKANSTIAGMVLEAGKPLLSSHVDNRISLNLQDLRRIVEAIETQPEAVAAKLSGEAGAQFAQLFLP